MQINCFIMSMECINLQKKSKFIAVFFVISKKKVQSVKVGDKKKRKTNNIIWHQDQQNSLLATQIVYPNEKNEKTNRIYLVFATKVISFCKSPANRI